MSQPTPYNRVTSFTNTFAASPNQVFPGASLDTELNNAKTTLDQILANLQLIQKDDGTIANGIIGPNQLSSQISVGFTAPTVWQTGVSYTTSPIATVFHGTAFYTCQKSHTSGVFATDLTAGDWLLVLDFTTLPLTTAVQVAVTPAGTITQTNVQTALQQLDSLKQATATLASTSLIDATAFGRSLITAADAGTALGSLTSGAATWTARQTQTYTPVFDLGSNQFSANMVFNSTGIVVPAGDTFNFISIRQTSGATNTVTPGAGSIGNGIWIDLEATSGSDAASNVYPLVAHVTNSGPGTVKAIHADAIAKVGSTGPMCSVNAETQPVSTTGTGSSCVQLALVQDAGAADGIVTGIFPISVANDAVSQGSQFLYVVGSAIRAIPIKNAFYQAWMATSSATNARAFTTQQDNGTEIQYIKKTGEVVSSTGLTAGTEANGITITQSNVTRNNSAGNLIVESGTGATQISLKAGGNDIIDIPSTGIVAFPNAGSVASLGSGALSITSVGAAGAQTTIQGFLKLSIGGVTRYVPFF